MKYLIDVIDKTHTIHEKRIFRAHQLYGFWLIIFGVLIKSEKRILEIELKKRINENHENLFQGNTKVRALILFVELCVFFPAMWKTFEYFELFNVLGIMDHLFMQIPIVLYLINFIYFVMVQLILFTVMGLLACAELRHRKNRVCEVNKFKETRAPIIIVHKTLLFKYRRSFEYKSGLNTKSFNFNRILVNSDYISIF